jgi:NADP-dependent 3-hydroxy acid dehydrogenase YdfG
LLEVNRVGVLHGLRAFVPRMIERPRPSRLLMTASLAGLLAFPGGGACGATKHALGRGRTDFSRPPRHQRERDPALPGTRAQRNVARR